MRDDPESPPRPRRLAPLIIAVPIILGLAVRLVGIRHGEPDKVYHPDIAKQTRVAISLFNDGVVDLRGLYKEDVRFTMYPYGTAHILAHAGRAYVALTSDNAFGDVHCWTWALRMRYLSATFFAVSMVILLCGLYGRLGPAGILLVGLLLAFEPTHNLYSHYGMNDVPLVATLLLTWLFSGHIAGSQRAALYAFLSGFFLGLGFGIKYQAILGVIFPLCGIIASLAMKRVRPAMAATICVAAGILVACAMSAPLIFTDPGYFLTQFPEFMKWQANILGEPSSLTEKLSRNIPRFVELALTPGRWLLLPMLVMSVYRLVRRSNRDPSDVAWSGSALAFCAILATLLVTSRDIVRDNDLMPIHAFVIIIAGFMIGCRRDHAPAIALKQRARTLGRVFGSIACLFFIGESLADSRALSRPDTRILARDWCRENIPTGSIVIRERYTLPIDLEGIEEHA